MFKKELLLFTLVLCSIVFGRAFAWMDDSIDSFYQMDPRSARFERIDLSMDQLFMHEDNVYAVLDGTVTVIEVLFQDDKGYYILAGNGTYKCPAGHFSPGDTGYCIRRDCYYYYQNHMDRLSKADLYFMLNSLSEDSTCHL